MYKEWKISLRHFILGIIGIAIAFFILGWIFPIEGPIDYVYDDYASQPAHKSPTKAAPPSPFQIIIDINDLSEEDFEALQAVFNNYEK